MLDEGFWAEIRVGGEHLRLFSERNALGVQTAARFDRLENEVRTGFAETRRGFAEMRGKLDQTAAGHQNLVELLKRLLPDDER